MKPEQNSKRLLGITRSKAKMLEYDVPPQYHINVPRDLSKLFTFTIGLLGDLAAALNRNEATPESLGEMKSNLLFSAHFFDSYLQTKLNEELDPHLMLLGSASYYLCDLPGSASVLARCIPGGCPDLGGEGLEALLLWLLKSDTDNVFVDNNEPFGKFLDGISQGLSTFYEDGTGEEDLLALAEDLRNTVYKMGTPRQLLFGDMITAILQKKLESSAWKALPRYSRLTQEQWADAIQKKSFIREFWPAQHLMGKAGVLAGASSIVQMPTSAGKTKATELVLRSAFIAERTSLALIIAPFRALCHEIRDSLSHAFAGEPIDVEEVSDVIQFDIVWDDFSWTRRKKIFVLTPEKLYYLLQFDQTVATEAGLVIFDEGHQFDSGTRGITYELLLTSLRSMIPETAQKILISAVISNAESVGEWLNGEANVVKGTSLLPTFRSVGFASWVDQLGRIEYVDSQDAEKNEFYVPRVLEQFNLGKRGRERTDRFFPDPNDGKTIALYLGLKLASNGSIAIFCGRKSTAANICEKAVDIISRKFPVSLPLEFSDVQEVDRLQQLHVQNLGPDAPSSQSAAHGIFSHHANTPHGIRLAVEYAMRENLIRFVVCTSTLAQGVNLPIRYLIVTSVYQGTERIKVRDFHNLIGRAGRSGMHTEGSILFADPNVYDKRTSRREGWRWSQVKELLDPANSEPCISDLLSIFEPIRSDDQKYSIKMDPLEFASAYINAPDEVAQLASNVAEQHGDKGFTQAGVERQVARRINLICAVESFLLSHWGEERELSDDEAVHLAEKTLAYHLGDTQQREQICELFKLLTENVLENITDLARRKSYGRTMFGIREAQSVEHWVQENFKPLLSLSDEEGALELLWPLLSQHIKGGIFAKFNKPEIRKEIACGWINGVSFAKLFAIIQKHGARRVWGTQLRDFKIDDIVDLCEGSLAYDGTLVVGAVCEFVKMHSNGIAEDVIKLLNNFQKRLKYGLPTKTAVVLYELGFADRAIAQDLEYKLNLTAEQRTGVASALLQSAERAIKVSEKYPAYFREKLNDILGE